MSIDRSRIALLAGAAALILATGLPSAAGSQPLPGITVYKSPT